MGWAESGALIAVACYALYRYPRTTTEPELQQKANDSEAHDANSTNPAIENVNTTYDDAGDSAASGGGVKHFSATDNSRSIMQKVERERSKEDDYDDECQTTPKVPMVPTTPALQVPVLNLDGDNVGSEEETRPDQYEQAKQPAPVPVEEPRVHQRAPNPTVLMPPPQLPASRMPPIEHRPPALNIINSNSNNNDRASSLVPNRSLSVNPNSRSSTGNSSLQPPLSAAASLRCPQGNRGRSSALSPGVAAKPGKASSKRVVLEPGYSPLDWAALTASRSNKLRGANLPPYLIRVTPSMLKVQNGRRGHDAWTSYQGKVYNITPYLPFHPGGKGELMRGAGKDSGKLFSEIHPWVNWDAMLGECLVGILVPEHEGQRDRGGGNNVLDEMD